MILSGPFVNRSDRILHYSTTIKTESSIFVRNYEKQKPLHLDSSPSYCDIMWWVFLSSVNFVTLDILPNRHLILQIFDNHHFSLVSTNIMSCVNMASAVLTEEPSTSTASTSSDADALDLLQRLQHAIFSGQPQMAADVASELAKMRANCSMSIRRYILE